MNPTSHIAYRASTQYAPQTFGCRLVTTNSIDFYTLTQQAIEKLRTEPNQTATVEIEDLEITLKTNRDSRRKIELKIKSADSQSNLEKGLVPSPFSNIDVTYYRAQASKPETPWFKELQLSDNPGSSMAASNLNPNDTNFVESVLKTYIGDGEPN